MKGLDYWRLCDEVSVIQAALLIIDVDCRMSRIRCQLDGRQASHGL